MLIEILHSDWSILALSGQMFPNILLRPWQLYEDFRCKNL